MNKERNNGTENREGNMTTETSFYRVRLVRFDFDTNEMLTMIIDRHGYSSEFQAVQSAESQFPQWKSDKVWVEYNVGN